MRFDTSNLDMDKKSLIYKIGAFAVALFIFCSMGELLVPFVLGLILAYAFHVPSQKISAYLKVSSTVSAMLIVLLVVSIFVFSAICLTPFIKNSAVTLLDKLPILVEKLLELLSTSTSRIGEIFGVRTADVNLFEATKTYLNHFAVTLPGHIVGFVNTGVTLMYVVMFIFMTPIITFYILKDWDKVEHYFISITHRFFSKSVNTVIQDINGILGQYIIGQLLVCSILAFVYSVVLWAIGIDQYIVCGAFSGFMSFVPFLGPLTAFVITSAVAAESYSTLLQYILTGVLYILIPFIDSNFLTPRFIGKRVGIQPFWILFSICATVSIFGFVGMFVSVPLAIVLSTICKNIVHKL
ncbi:MAG: AI-2E family transporter [Holosporales bacterium]|jgi:predicted PurR-regulated permease PerM|nr:AI-2E family transporter [Holosporales bacterium]